MHSPDWKSRQTSWKFPIATLQLDYLPAPSLDALRDTHHLISNLHIRFRRRRTYLKSHSHPSRNCQNNQPNCIVPLLDFLDLIKDHILDENSRLKSIYEESCLDEDGTLESSASHRWEDGPIKKSCAFSNSLCLVQAKVSSVPSLRFNDHFGEASYGVPQRHSHESTSRICHAPRKIRAHHPEADE